MKETIDMKTLIKNITMLALLVLTALLVGSCGSDDTNSNSNNLSNPGVVRTYYIAADEVNWDYSPDGNVIHESFDESADVFLTNAPFDPAGLVTGSTTTVIEGRIGKVYKKALYREYTDETFAALKPVPPEWQHLGAMGPMIRAVVGDTIVVVFKNNTQFDASMHPHGVFYDKDSEGAVYNDGVVKTGDKVAPGATHVYTWPVPERAGPGPMEGDSIGWMYHSHVDETVDTYTGLIGPMIVTRKGRARPDGSPLDADRELFNLYHVYNENNTHYTDENIATLATVTDPADIEALKADPDFEESNLMHTINGYVFSKIPGLTMKKGERVRWYLMGMGTEVDIHTPHWHGNVVTVNGMRMDVVSVFPATMITADMEADNAGEWLYHCHVNDHIDAGMITTFTVEP
jgi:FtsP/CotA-like multicopper oxidase with cupredoxin domain